VTCLEEQVNGLAEFASFATKTDIKLRAIGI